jgi:tRNA(Ile2) C34 agmatinyltransferase TiaS
VTSQGAFIVETEDGRTLCKDCRGAGACERCGRETDQTTLSGAYRCRECARAKRAEDRTREAGQQGLGEFER